MINLTLGDYRICDLEKWILSPYVSAISFQSAQARIWVRRLKG